jgi:hypothetical protein
MHVSKRQDILGGKSFNVRIMLGSEHLARDERPCTMHTIVKALSLTHALIILCRFVRPTLECHAADKLSPMNWKAIFEGL